jgi:hypothetical protein
MSVDPVRVVGPVAIRQVLEATNNFTGAAVADGGVAKSPVYTAFSFIYAAADTGGLFDPSATTLYGFDRPDPVDLIGVSLDLDDQTSWSLDKYSADGAHVSNIASGTTEASYEKTDDFRVTLLWGQTIKLTTLGATKTLSAELTFEPHKT